MAAGELAQGNSITSRAGPKLSVVSVSWQRQTPAELSAGSQGYTVYNFEVEKTHTFFVGTEDGGTWVHNLPCWKRGDPIDAQIRGREPSWSTVRRRYWQNKYNQRNAPIDPNYLDEEGNPVRKELHHIQGRDIRNPHSPSNLVEVWPWEHDMIDADSKYSGERPPGMGPGF